jgi:hypothetical protein
MDDACQVLRDAIGDVCAEPLPDGGRVPEPNDSALFEGLVLRIRYAVDDATGRELENKRFRAEKEHEVTQELPNRIGRSPFSGSASITAVALEPAGNNVTVVANVDNLNDQVWDDVFARMDEAMRDALDASRDRADQMFPDHTSWEIRCRDSVEVRKSIERRELDSSLTGSGF